MTKNILRILLVLVVAFVQLPSMAQNVQFHYDFGHSMYDETSTRPEFTTTVEMFRADKWGSTFFFVDMDYAHHEVSSAYWEIAREFNMGSLPFSLHLEYNGGLNYIKDAYLAGVTYAWNNPNYTRGITFTPMYKYIYGNENPHNFQLTSTWYVHLFNKKISFTGFADLWQEKHTDCKGKEHYFTFLAEPQLWINLNRFSWIDDDFNLSIGGEVELSNDFATMHGFYAIPTIAAKWEF